jgi:hypothetical protein
MVSDGVAPDLVQVIFVPVQNVAAWLNDAETAIKANMTAQEPNPRAHEPLPKTETRFV